MIIENEFTVDAEIESVWRELLDMEGVAGCLPGATITSTDEDNVYDGSMRLKVGPMRVEYRGTATLSEVDDESHTAVISLSAREAKGQGSAMATIRNRLEPAGTGTHVTAQTELHITGPQAQFGRGVIEDVGRRILAQFSHCLEQKIAGAGGDAAEATARDAGSPDAASADGTSAPTAAESGVGASGADATAPAQLTPTLQHPPVPAPQPVADELDVGSLLASTPAVRIGAAALLVLVLVIVLRRRR
jgi:carbon monoxide dehydrogenase subunit G